MNIGAKAQILGKKLTKWGVDSKSIAKLDKSISELESMKTVFQKTKKNSPIVNESHCLPDYIRNPKTGKCIRRDGKTGSTLVGKTEFSVPLSNPVKRKTRKQKGKKIVTV